MMELNKIYNEDCNSTLQKMDNHFIDIVLTSPPYNTGRPTTSDRGRENHEGRYDVHMDTVPTQEFIDWIITLFNQFDRVLKPNGCVLWNMSYASDESVNTDNNDMLWLVIADIIKRTNFTVVDNITWKKNSALPNNVSKNKLTRICEPVFVFSRKDERMTFTANKKVSSVGKNGQTFYTPVENFIQARNNDENCPLNKATYSSDLCEQLLNIYAKPGSVVYDPFMGSGTTAVACKRLGHSYIGSEISANQVSWAEERISGTKKTENGATIQKESLF